MKRIHAAFFSSMRIHLYFLMLEDFHKQNFWDWCFS